MSDPRLCLALDGPAAADPTGWIQRTRRVFGVYKVGLELFCRRGPAIIAACRAAGAEQIFLDLKLHDIPRTVARTVSALSAHRVDYLTVHAAGGRQMLTAAQAEAASVRLLAITVLTSLSAADAALLGFADLEAAVRVRAEATAAAGLYGVVCSPHEAATVRRAGLHAVTPGIRWPDGPRQDQARVADPTSALANGASLLVIGRLITQSTALEADLERLEAACR